MPRLPFALQRPQTPRSIAIGLALCALAGCAGERPTVTPQAGPARAVVNDPAVIAVNDLLGEPPPQFTAEYRVTPTAAGTEPTIVTVWRNGGEQHIKAGTIDIYADDASAVDDTSAPETNSDQAIASGTTCTADGSSCSPGVNDGFLSNLSITHQFWSSSSSRRLLNDSTRKIGPTKPSTATIAGQQATCVGIPLGGETANGTVTYCAAESGILARYSGADTAIELMSMSDTVDPADVTPPSVG